MDLDRYRLPRTVEPSRYDLTIEPDDQSSTFTGGVDVAVTVNEPVTAIVLNAVELAIPGGSLTSVHGGRRIDVSDVSFDRELQRATLTLAGSAEPGDWILHLDFHGALNDRLARDVIDGVLAGEGSPDEVVAARGLAVVSDEGALTAAVDQAIAAHPDVAAKIRDGKVAAAGVLVGAVMNATRSQADAARVRELILQRLA